MSYLERYTWELVPENLPMIKRNCPKCNEKTQYKNSEKFRVNANKNNLDIWLIFQCEHCKSTWNMTLYERIKPHEISPFEYEGFLANDKDLVRAYAFNIGIYSKNKAEILLDDVTYQIISSKIESDTATEEQFAVQILCKYPLELRADKFLSDALGLSRSKIKNMHAKGLLFIKDDKQSLNTKIRNGLEIHIFKEKEPIEMAEAIVNVG